MSIANGSDAGLFAHDSNARELAWMLKLGMTPVEALRSASVTGAAVLGKSAELGQLKAGMLADIVAVGGATRRPIFLIFKQCDL
ncbi:amidohydrolase family protein [Massilia frigida]|uniref:amidohydrolase family protein n=1 Tax=Massilia frigida TaxID=2609281 RepID=UPI00351D45A9